ncbi:alpha-amylase family glycosyl hydrolase [Anaeromyxobacter sp. Red801]|uniref:alpha-amylase family glycosyl hydrolase n=1 Tax=Anaeromyxobacter sp. Red801 TaxID=3411632 RepID=UPI003BA219EE
MPPMPSSPALRRARLAAALLPCLAALALAACAPRAPSGPPAGAAAAAALAEAPPRPLPPRPWQDEVLYFVLVDRFADGDRANDRDVDLAGKGTFHGGDLRGLTAHLDEIAALGVTAIWVNPLVRNIPGYVSGAGFPDWAYHGYWMDDLSRLDPRFGSEADLAAFVNACHARGIRVLLDVVYNHAGYDTAYLRDPRTRPWLRNNVVGDCGDDDLTSCLAGLPDWKTERPEVREFLLAAQLGWAKRSGVDGFRLDTVKHVEPDFWELHRRRVRAELVPGFFLLGELWGGDRESLDPYFAADTLDAGLDFGFQGSTVGWLLGRGRTVAYERYLASRHKVRAGHLLAHYLSSHDQPGALHLLGGDRALFRLAALLQLTTVGIPTLYYGEEVARPIGEWPDNRSDMPWGQMDVLPGAGKPRDEAMRAFYRRVVALRRAHPALSRGTHEPLATDGDGLVFLRRDGDDAVLVAVNRGKAPLSLRIPVPPAWEGRELEDALEGGAISTGPGGMALEVPGRGARVVVAKPAPGAAIRR